MKKLLYLLIFALPATLFLGCQEEEDASIYYLSEAPAFRLGDDIERLNEEEIPEVDIPGKALLTACSAQGNAENCEPVSTMLIFRRPMPRPRPCDAGICEPISLMSESHQFDPKYNHIILVIDRESGEVITEFTDVYLEKSTLHFGGDLENLLVPSGFTLLSINTSVMIDREPVLVNYTISINPESLEEYY